MVSVHCMLTRGTVWEAKDLLTTPGPSEKNKGTHSNIFTKHFPDMQSFSKKVYSGRKSGITLPTLQIIGLFSKSQFARDRYSLRIASKFVCIHSNLATILISDNLTVTSMSCLSAFICCFYLYTTKGYEQYICSGEASARCSFPCYFCTFGWEINWKDK